jgi:hypothetical protein
VTRFDEQAAAVLRREPDVVCLQEVTATTLPRWTEALAPMRVQCLLPAERRLAALLAAHDLEPAEPPPVERRGGNGRAATASTTSWSATTSRSSAASTATTGACGG